MIKILPLNKFRLLKDFSKHFKITEETVITYNGIIYSNKDLYPDVLEHEKVHIKQQNKHGLKNFIDKYLNDKSFRLEVEKEAYITQLQSIKDEGLREAVRLDCIVALISGLYGKISKREAEAMLFKEKEGLDVNKLI